MDETKQTENLELPKQDERLLEMARQIAKLEAVVLNQAKYLQQVQEEVQRLLRAILDVDLKTTMANTILLDHLNGKVKVVQSSALSVTPDYEYYANKIVEASKQNNAPKQEENPNEPLVFGGDVK